MVAGRWVQLWFRVPWAEPPAGIAPVSRVRRLLVPVANRVLIALPEQQTFPVVRLFDFEQKKGKRRKCSPFARARTVALGPERKEDGRQRGFWDVDLERLRPKIRADCVDGPRPCPWIGCRYHLAITVDPEKGSVKETFPQLEIWANPEGEGLAVLESHVGTCALDVCAKHDDGTGGVGGLIALYQAATSGKPLGQTPGMTIGDTGRRLNLSIERTRQLSSAAMQELRVKFRREL